jgi:hypothetical protein
MKSWWKGSNIPQLSSGRQLYKNLFPDTTSASVLLLTTLRSTLYMYMCIFFVR